ncbi:GSK3B-interacting protein [Aplysia californica]|uniref:GSK3B-interacting protein n=1 Tax=Aplysia californica TaxID=6500 RepID=A0ABM0JGT2_APLCA|nr:GSK3B-interacting protein [Aplysia californica]
MHIDDDKALTIEAAEVVKEIAYAVNDVQISSMLPADVNLIYINITTKENQHLCVELSLQGFRVVGYQYNEVNPQHYSRHYETIYSLLDSHSAEYRSTFCETLTHKLLSLQQRHSGEEDTSDDQMDTK